MKRFNKPIFIFLFSLLLCSCQHTPKLDTYAHVTFKNYDESVLYHTKVEVGEKVYYKGEHPQKHPTQSEVYTFTGWDYDLEQPITTHITIKALYEESVREYIVTFKNYDDKVLQTKNVPYGTYATYTAKEPTKPSNDRHFEYEFSGWDKSLTRTRIDKDTTFTAQYKTNEFVYATFKNYDDKFLSEEKVVKGEDAVYSGINPTKLYTGTEKKTYRFSGWDKNTENLLEDTTFIAQFDLLNIYTVTFKNYDGTILQTKDVVHGDSVKYTGSTPTRASSQSGNYKYTYTFSGWDRSLNNVTSSFTTTAKFTSTSEYYNPVYQAALRELKNFCTDLAADQCYKGVIFSGIMGSYYDVMQASYNPSNGVCSLEYMSMGRSTTISRQVIIYLPPSEPGSYDYYFINRNSPSDPVLSGVGEISSYYNEDSYTYFTSVIEYKSNASVSWHEDKCNDMLKCLLLMGGADSNIDLYDLGFYYY